MTNIFGGGGRAPRAPDPGYVSNMQTTSNIQSAIANSYLNNVNQRGPGGSLTYNQVKGPDGQPLYNNVNGNLIPQFEAVQEYSPEQQKLYDSETRISQGYADLGEGYISQIRDATKTPFSYAGMPDAPRAPQAGGRMVAPTPNGVPQYDDAYQNRVYGQMVGRAAPRIERERAALENRLANKGIPNAGSEAGDAEWDNFNKAQNDFYAATDLASGDAATQRYNNQLAGDDQGWRQRAQEFDLNLGADSQNWGQRAQQYGFEGSDRDRAINDALRLRQLPINEASALFNLGNGVQGPQFVNTAQSQVQPTDVSGNYANNYAARLANYQQQQNASNAGLGGLMGLVGTLGGAALGGPLGARAGGFLGGLMGRG